MSLRNKREPIVDMNEIANRMNLPALENPSTPEAYAQPHYRQGNKVDQTIKTVDEFKALPTTEIDDIINAAEQELNALKVDAQLIRDQYVQKVEELKRNIKRIMAGCVLAHETMNELRKQVEALDNPQATPQVEAASQPVSDKWIEINK